MKSVIIDTDPGIDDAVALGVALSSEKLKVKLITTVAGNVNLKQTTDNANTLLNFWNKNIPIASGSETPLICKPNEVRNIHGETGLGGFVFPENSNNNVCSDSAVNMMFKKIMETDATTTIIALGPLTNIAILIKMYPVVKDKIEIVCMGGSTERGNETAAAEYNFHADPHAAKIVLDSGINLTIIGLNVTNTALFDRQFLDEIKNENETGKMINDMFQHYRGGSALRGYKMHDLCAVLYTINPEIFEKDKFYVDIETSEGLCRGACIVDLMKKSNIKENAVVCLSLDVQQMKDISKKQILKLN